MTKASDNAFPSILITEGTEPSAPAAGKQRVYIDSTTHHLMRTNSSGTETDIESVPTSVGCKVYNSTTQNISNTTDTKLTFDSEVFDTNTFHDTSSNTSRITIPSGKGGTYLIACSMTWDTNATNQRNIRFLKNGTTVIRGGHIQFTGLSAGLKVMTSTIEQLVATDYVEVNVWQNSGGTRTVGSATDNEQTAFWVFLLGA